MKGLEEELEEEGISYLGGTVSLILWTVICAIEQQ
jgi:hypothetical protein